MPGQSIVSVQKSSEVYQGYLLGANLNLPPGRLGGRFERKVQEGSAGRFEPSSYFGLCYLNNFYHEEMGTYDWIRWSRPSPASFFAWDCAHGMARYGVPTVLGFAYKTTGTDLWYTQMISSKRFAIRITVSEIWALYDDRFEVEILAKSQDLRLTIVFIK